MLNQNRYSIKIFLNCKRCNLRIYSDNRLIVYDVRDLGKQLKTVGMLVVLDAIFNRITRNRSEGRRTAIFIDEIYLLFGKSYSANFLLEMWKRVRKYGAFYTGISQNTEDLLQSHTARTMLERQRAVRKAGMVIPLQPTY